MIEQIISGGQTGVDQAGLFVATEFEIPIGGWCPKGGLDENGQNILDKYPLFETNSPNPDDRTKLNIKKSDGTLVLVPNLPLPKKISDGTTLTIEHASNQNKPLLIINLSNATDASTRISKWIEENNIKVLNIAGPRESNSPGIYETACNLFKSIFPILISKPRQFSLS